MKLIKHVSPNVTTM